MFTKDELNLIRIALDGLSQEYTKDLHEMRQGGAPAEDQEICNQAIESTISLGAKVRGLEFCQPHPDFKVIPAGSAVGAGQRKGL